MLRRSFLLALGGLGLSAYTAHARAIPRADFRTADLMGGSFAMQTTQIERHLAILTSFKELG